MDHAIIHLRFRWRKTSARSRQRDGETESEHMDQSTMITSWPMDEYNIVGQQKPI